MEELSWPLPIVLEYPFWRDGMSLDEFEIERTYYWKNLKKIKDKTYKPLWKQREEENAK